LSILKECFIERLRVLSSKRNTLDVLAQQRKSNRQQHENLHKKADVFGHCLESSSRSLRAVREEQGIVNVPINKKNELDSSTIPVFFFHKPTTGPHQTAIPKLPRNNWRLGRGLMHVPLQNTL
jgi:hypothetical protein